MSQGRRDLDMPGRVLVVQRGGSNHYAGVIAGWSELRSTGLIDALEHAVVDARQPVDTHALWSGLSRVVQEHDIDTVVLHHFHAKTLGDPRLGIETIRAASPGVFLVISNGDPFMNGVLGRPSPPRMLLQAASVSDLVLSSSMGLLADEVARHTSAPVVLLPFGVHAPQFELVGTPTTPEFDVAFIGSNNRSRNPLKPYHRFAVGRERLIRSMYDRFGARFAVFGKGWEGLPCWHGPVPFDHQWMAARRARVVIGGVPFSANRYYLSDRPFIQAASGVPFVDLHVDGVDRILREGEHWHLVDHVEEYADRCDWLLSMPDHERAEMGAAAAATLLASHTEAERVRSEFRTIAAARTLRRRPESNVLPDFSAFLQEVDRDAELPLATRNWPPRTS